MKRLLIPLFALGLLLSACTGADSGTIKIGLITPLTGDVSALGKDILNGAQMRVNEVNAAGGIDGKMIELIVEDGKCSAVDAASAAQKLINIDNVVAIHGAGCSGESLAAAPIANDAGVVLMSPSSTSPDVTDAGDFVFRTIPSDGLKTVAMAQYFAEQGYEKIAILGENTDFCGAFRSSLMNDFGAEKFVFDEVVEPGTKDFRTLLTRLQGEEFDILVANAQSPAIAAAMLQQIREFGLEQPIIGQDIMDSLVVIEIAQDAAEGAMTINVPDISATSEFGTKFIETNGEPSSNLSWGAYGYDTMAVLAQALTEAGAEGTAVRDYLYSMPEYPGVVGPIAFDGNGDVKEASYVLKAVQDGAFVKIQDITVE